MCKIFALAILFITLCGYFDSALADDDDLRRVGYTQSQPNTDMYINVGFGYAWLDHAGIDQLTATRKPGLGGDAVAGITQFSSKSVRGWLPNINLAFGQIFSNSIGYEINASYYLGQTATTSYTGTYPLNPEADSFGSISAKSSKQSSAIAAEMMFLGQWRLASWLDIIGKVGFGFIHMSEQEVNYSALINHQINVDAISQANVHNDFGPALAAEFRFHITTHIALSLNVNELAAANHSLAINGKIGYLF